VVVKQTKFYHFFIGFLLMRNKSVDNKQRPILIPVFKYRYPITAIASVLHRGSGVILFLVIPFLLCALQASLSSPESFQNLKAALQRPFAISLLWLVLAALFYHLVAGIRHLLMDVGVGESRRAGRITAWLVILATVLLLLAAAIWWAQ
jgi:succinate dehydrogenase / fumarate reductase cytochrome b subunit